MAAERIRSPLRRVRNWGTGFAVLLAITAVWGVRQAREAGRRTSCICNVKNLALACHNYQSQYGVFPPAYIADSQGRPMHSWRVLLLPYLNANELYARYDFAEPWDGPNNIKLLDEMPSVFACPSCNPQPRTMAAGLSFSGIFACGIGAPSDSARSKFTSYAAVLGPRGIFRGADPVSMDQVTDGLGQTLFIGEVADANIFWTRPEDIDIAAHPKLGDRKGFSSEHPGVVVFSFADGRQRTIDINSPQEIIDAYFTRNGREKFPNSD